MALIRVGDGMRWWRRAESEGGRGMGKGGREGEGQGGAEQVRMTGEWWTRAGGK